VWPVKTNAAFLARAAAHPEFVAGRIDTAFIDKHLAELVPEQPTPTDVLAAAAHARLEQYRERVLTTPWGAANGFRLNADAKREVEVQTGAQRSRVVLGDEPPPSLRVIHAGAETLVWKRGELFVFEEPRTLAAGEGAAADGVICAPIPGRIIAVQVSDGASVVQGQALVTVEAMKMEHTLTAPFDGLVAGLTHKVGDQVSDGSVLLRIVRESS